MADLVRVRGQKTQAETQRGTKRSQPLYQFVDHLPEGVTPAEARERVVAAFGAVLLRRGAR